MTPGKLTPVSAGTLQGVFRPQVRFYYHNARHGICFETITKPLRCRSRARAVKLAKEWMETEEFNAALNEVKARVLSHEGNSF